LGRPLVEHLLLGDPKLPGIGHGQFVVLPHEHGIHRANLFAVTAIDAQPSVNNVTVHHLLVILPLGSHYGDSRGRTYLRAQPATDTALLIVFMAFQDLRAPEPVGEVVIFLQVPQGHRFREKITESKGEPLDQICLENVGHQTHGVLPFIR